jgi:hypothetical protein
MHTLTITPAGGIEFIYSDELVPLLDLGQPTIRRASHVEPNEAGRWVADLSPVNGPKLGPFEKRQEALDAEVAWLRAHGY